MEIINVEQGTPEWFALRIGSIGGSSISSVVAGGQGKTRNQLMYRLAGEILSGEKYSGYANDHMARGIEQEPEARELYSFLTDTEVAQVGMFRYSEHEHFSPDGDIESKGGIIEIKSVIPSVHIETICFGKVPAQYRKQVQWGLRERDWCDFISYSPLVVDKPIWIKRVKRDAKMIETLIDGAAKFVDEMLAIVEKIRVK